MRGLKYFKLQRSWVGSLNHCILHSLNTTFAAVLYPFYGELNRWWNEVAARLQSTWNKCQNKGKGLSPGRWWDVKKPPYKCHSFFFPAHICSDPPFLLWQNESSLNGCSLQHRAAFFPFLMQFDLCRFKMKAFKTYVFLSHSSLQWHGRNYVDAYRLSSTALSPSWLMIYVWLPSEDLVNAVASWWLTDTPACHGWSPYRGQTN